MATMRIKDNTKKMEVWAQTIEVSQLSHNVPEFTLNTEVYKRFLKEGIEIPFPQRDIHIRSVTAPPGVVK